MYVLKKICTSSSSVTKNIELHRISVNNTRIPPATINAHKRTLTETSYTKEVWLQKKKKKESLKSSE